VENKIIQIKKLVKQLNRYRHEYYNLARPSVSDAEYDQLFDELNKLELETGFVLINSPTQTVGYEVKSKLDKIVHEYPMLSLDKTKDIKNLVKFMGEQECLLMLKLDGLTVSLTYDGGELVRAETRGDGKVGEDILHTAKTFINIPKKLPIKNRLVISGEAIISQADFNRINNNLPANEEPYKNPRNLVSASVRLLDANIAAQRSIRFIGWRLEEGCDDNSFINRLELLNKLNFETTPFVKIYSKPYCDNLSELIDSFKNTALKLGYPIDGLVLSYNDIAYGRSLGATGHHLRSQIAFKFEDTVEPTRLIDVEFTMGTTGVLTPTAVFEPVELEGTIVERASLHNLSIMKKLGIAKKCTLNVFKANQIIPQVESCENDGEGEIDIPKVCPVCGSATKIRKNKDTKVLYCSNGNCKGKLLGKLCHFTSRSGFYIQGLSEATLSKFIKLGWVSSFVDIFKLAKYKTEISLLEGFGEKSVDNLLAAIEKSKKIKLEKFIDALGIPLIGSDASRKISIYCKGSLENFLSKLIEGFSWNNIEGIGDVMNRSIQDWANEENIKMLFSLLDYITIVSSQSNNDATCVDLSGKIFVVTGTVYKFKNRAELQAKIETLGGRCSGSISHKTSYLINNDVNSSSKKSREAKKLNIPIITEDEFIEMIAEKKGEN